MEAAIQHALEQVFGAGKISKVEFVGRGYEAEIFGFELAANERRVLRLFHRPEDDSKAAAEAAVMARLHEIGYPVPHVDLSLASADSPLGRPLVVMERIDGESLGPAFWGGPPEVRRRAEERVYRLMSDLHAIETLAVFPGRTGAIGQELAILNSDLPWLKPVLDWLSAEAETISEEPSCVVHGDFHANNVLETGDRCVVIDWSNCRPGDYRWDVAWIRLLVRADECEDGGQRSLAFYERFSGRRPRRLDFFEVMGATKILLESASKGRTKPDTSFTDYLVSLIERRTSLKLQIPHGPTK